MQLKVFIFNLKNLNKLMFNYLVRFMEALLSLSESIFKFLNYVSYSYEKHLLSASGI